MREAHEVGARQDTDRDDVDQGSATAEYAIVTVAAAGFAAVLVALLKSPEVRDMLLGLVQSALGS